MDSEPKLSWIIISLNSHSLATSALDITSFQTTLKLLGQSLVYSFHQATSSDSSDTSEAYSKPRDLLQSIYMMSLPIYLLNAFIDDFVVDVIIKSPLPLPCWNILIGII